LFEEALSVVCNVGRVQNNVKGGAGVEPGL